MPTRERLVIAPNTGKAFVARRGEVVVVKARTIVDLVAFNLHNLRERFDQARTKANQGTIFVTTGHYLYSQLNNRMFSIVEDTFTEGHHDLQSGMCSRRRWEILHASGPGALARVYKSARYRSLDDLPDHGCWENLTEALRPWGILPEDIPAPFNLFQNMEIDPVTGAMRHTTIRPRELGRVGLSAEMDCLVAVSACPDLVVGGQAVEVEILSENVR